MSESKIFLLKRQGFPENVGSTFLPLILQGSPRDSLLSKGLLNRLGMGMLGQRQTRGLSRKILPFRPDSITRLNPNNLESVPRVVPFSFFESRKEILRQVSVSNLIFSTTKGLTGTLEFYLSGTGSPLVYPEYFGVTIV